MTADTNQLILCKTLITKYNYKNFNLSLSSKNLRFVIYLSYFLILKCKNEKLCFCISTNKTFVFFSLGSLLSLC